MISDVRSYQGLPDLNAIMLEHAPDAVLLDPMSTDIRPYVSFTPEGRVWMAGVQPSAYTQEDIDAGGLYVFGEARANPEGFGWLDYVDWEEDWGWKVVPRPALGKHFDRMDLKVGEEATMPDLPPARITFTGPVSGEQPHTETGDLTIGWRVPGTYEVRIEAFPALPALFTLTVSKP